MWQKYKETYRLETEKVHGFFSSELRYINVKPFVNFETGEVKLFRMDEVEKIGADNIIQKLNGIKNKK